MQPLEFSAYHLPLAPPKLEPIAHRLLPSELASQRSPVARDDEAYPFSFRHLLSPENIGTYEDVDFGVAEGATDPFKEDDADEPAHEIDLDEPEPEPEPEPAGLLKSLFANLGASFAFRAPSPSPFATSSVRADEPPPLVPPFGISPFQIHSPTPHRPPFAIDPFLDAGPRSPSPSVPSMFSNLLSHPSDSE